MKTLSNKLCKWYNDNKFSLPWRKNNKPYDVWISEIMLQQTQVSTVIPYYKRWMKTFNTIDKVAEAHIDKILKFWEGLGYYQRAHNIHETAQKIVQNYKSIIPCDYKQLVAFKGIGDYTASAILSISYSQKYPAIDGNLKRVIARLAGISNFQNISSKSKKFAMHLMLYNKPEFINQSLMDLGREVCLPRNPQCSLCPVLDYCVAYKQNKISYYSFKKVKKSKPNYNVSIGIIWEKEKFLISKRKKNGLLGGLWELPGGKEQFSEGSIKCLHREIYEELGLKIKSANQIGMIKHHYSHFSINLTGYHCFDSSGIAQAKSSDAIKWIKPKDIMNYAFPKATMKLFILAGLVNE